MPGLWGVLGYDRVAHEIAASLRDETRVTVLQGPPGTGKSWLAKAVGALWAQEGGSVVVAEGDRLHDEEPLYPLGFALAELGGAWQGLGSPAADLARSGEGLVGTNGVITNTVQALAKLTGDRRQAQKLYLGEAEQRVVFDLHRHARDGPLLLIADNLHWWDRASLALLGRLREPRMRDAFPFLADMRVLAVQTPEPYQHVSQPDAHSAVLAPMRSRRFELARIGRERFDEVLVALGAPPGPAAEVVAAVHALSGGHLTLARQCASRLAQGDAPLFVAASDSDEFIRSLLTDRIHSLGDIGAQAVELLQVAALLGLRFREDEVRCAWGGTLLETRRLLRYCREQEMLDLDDGSASFAHDLFREHFLVSDDLDRTVIHERLVDCLRILSPADYVLRAQNAILAERSREAGTLAVQAALARVRDGLAWRDLPAPLLGVLERVGFETLTERLAAASEAISHYRTAEGVAILAALPHTMPRALHAEVDYLHASALMGTRSNEDRARARALLESWAGYEDEEVELGVRLMQLHLYGLMLLPDKQPGRALEARIKDVLRRRASVDQAAEDAFYVLDRRSGGLHDADQSLANVQGAVAHFGPREGEELVRRPLEYYFCLVNLASHLLTNARYDEAHAASMDLERFIAGYEPDVFPRLDYPMMNGLQAEYRAGLVDVREAVRRQREIVARFEVTADPFYVENALAVYLALAGEHAAALEIFDRLEAELGLRSEPETSMTYLIRANRCSVRFVAGDHLGLLEEWAALDAVIRQIPYTIGRALVRRHELLAEVFAAAEPMTARQLDDCLVVGRPPELGPMWVQLGRGFRMPEIVWWR